MSCVEKRHVSHRVGSMLHHRFPNGFTDLFMDETDREVSTLTDRAFRSLCVGDDAVYNDDFLYGYSPFSCHKPLAGEPLKKNNHKESKKQGQNKNDKNEAQPWKQQQQQQQQQQKKNMSHMSSFLKALSATEESCEGMLNRNGATTDCNGESWDKSALRSIQRELSEFSSDYHSSLRDRHYKNHGDGSSNKTGKDAGLPSGKSTKVKNGKSTVKLKKLNIKNFFLHSEYSPFQMWTDCNRFLLGQEDTVTSILPTDNIPKWYDLPFYKELTEAHRKETLHTEETQSCQKETVKPCPPTAPKPIPPPPPPKLLPKPSATPAEKRCTSDVGDGGAAPWRRNRSRAKSAIPVNQPVTASQDNQAKTAEEGPLFVKKETRSVEVKAIEEVSSSASTPFSICQLMTPLIPSRQPTETSEILQGVFSPSALDLPLRPHSEAKVTPEPPVKRESYKSLASSILFNLKDNRKRVKSRYSPPKFKTLEKVEGGTESPQSDHVKYAPAGSEGNTSGLSTPAILKDGSTICSPVLEPNSSQAAGLAKHDSDRPVSEDYLLSNLLQTKKEANSSLGEENPISPFINSKKNKSPMAKKPNYPSLNLYKKANPVDSDMKYLQVSQSTSTPAHIDQPVETNGVSPLMLNKALSPKALPTNTELSPNALNVVKDYSPIISPHTLEKEGLSSVGKRPPNVAEKAKRPVKDTKEKDIGVQPATEEKETGGQSMSTMDVIRAAREAINAAKNKALSATNPDSTNKPDIAELRQNQVDEKTLSSKSDGSVPENNNVASQHRNEVKLDGGSSNVKREPPPVPKRNFAKSDVLDKHNVDNVPNGDSVDTKIDLPPKEDDSVQKQGKFKHIFSSRQNNYIKHQRYAVTDTEPEEEHEEGDPKVNTRMETNDEIREMRDSEHIINDLQALKELGKARLGDRVLENARNKLGVVNIDEETKTKNDLISRELRNIKRGMLSMRGNTSAKREIFTKKEKEPSKEETFTKLDSNVIVNKARINDNYDKAKMALEEIISERQKRRNKPTEQDANPTSDESIWEESYAARLEQRKTAMKDSASESREKQNGSNSTYKEKDLKERLGDLTDHNLLRQILSQTEPRLGETHRSGGRMALPGMDKIGNELNALLQTKAKYVNAKLTDNPRHVTDDSEVNFRQVGRQVSEESGEYPRNETEGQKLGTPPVPPRSKKGGRREGSFSKDKDGADENVLEKDGEFANKEADSEEAAPSQRETSSYRERWNELNNTNDAAKFEPIVNSNHSQFENTMCLSPEFTASENKEDNVQIKTNPTKEATPEISKVKSPQQCKTKRKAPLRPDHLIKADNSASKTIVEKPENSRAGDHMNVDAETHSEIPRSMSPVQLVNGTGFSQSPPDQASLSSKSSYFSVESALHRNTETESNVYHSLENLIGEENVADLVDEVDETLQNLSQNTQQDSDRAEVEYYSLSDHESEPEIVKCQKEAEVPYNNSKEREDNTRDQNLTDEGGSTTMSPTNTFSPTLGIPALFKVKDNTVITKRKKTVQPWSPRESLSGSERAEEELNHIKENPDLPMNNETATSGSTVFPTEIFRPKEILSSQSPPIVLLSPPDLQSENPNIVQAVGFLTVPQEDDRFSGVSPSSEGVESLTTSATDVADEMAMNTLGLIEREVKRVPSEHSGSTCSGNDSQTGLPKPPAVLPKSEKAVLKAIKLANRRMKKEAQKSSQSSSSKHRADRHKSEKPEHKSSSTNSSSNKNSSSRSSEKKHRETTEDGHGQNESRHTKHSNDRSEQLPSSDEKHHNSRMEMRHKARRQSHDSVESNSRNREECVASERQGRSSNRQARDKPEQRHYSSDRVISNVPVYKAHVGDKPASDRPLHRSQSIDRYLGGSVERRLSADMSANERLDPRAQRIEKSIMDELQQRGRARDKASRDNPLRRSHSIDAYSTEMPHPSSLSRQSSHTSQLSRQSSIEHTIVTQSFPMTQRKLLQDPDSGQYYFVDMPVQVKTKTFFDPETGSYVQLPVQPPESAVPQVSPMEVLTPPLVVYHGFVPVPLSPMAQKAAIQAPQRELDEFEQRNLERSRQMHCKEGHPYLEPVYSQHDHMLGEFIGTEELDCPS
ncbi:uncharacterized protein LOC125023000 [Mugil cephalus]|uniref:uncharacterized protein LOC125023000 n=1 Tax=Mugil cephalus TaxID=48193 RepID=UPI001FB7D87B|nr:uncharacterized protein LOC125023000 [Mugil cephalus]